jgi:hypothetical protein
MKLQIDEGLEWIRFLFLFRQDYQDYQGFFACGEGLSAEGYPNDPVNPVQLFSLKKNPIPLFSNYIVSYLIRLDARGRRLG